MAHAHPTAVYSDGDTGRGPRRHVFHYIPGFLYILILYVIGQLSFSDPRATLITIGEFRVAWVELLLLAAAIMAMAEQLKVATPAVNNTTEVLFMGVIAIVQIVLFALAVADVPAFQMFNNTEFLFLTIINAAQTAVAYQINAATLVRTIASN
jgi:sensor histidine kinase YesM